MKAYCINLDRRPDRMAFMGDQFARHAIPFVRVSAVDGQDPAVAAEAARVGPSRLGPRMSAGAYACFQSHRAVWRRLVDSGDRHAMIFEDDLHLAQGIAQYLDDAWVPRDADVVRLETFGLRVHLGAGKGLPAGPRRLHRLRSYHPGCGGYVLSVGAAARLLEATGRFDDPVDYMLFSESSALFATLTTYQMLPAPVIQGDRAARGSTSGWAKSSIADRFAAGEVPTVMTRESALGRVARRLGAEVAGRLRGTRYRFVPHG